MILLIKRRLVFRVALNEKKLQIMSEMVQPHSGSLLQLTVLFVRNETEQRRKDLNKPGFETGSHSREWKPAVE